MGHLWYHAPEHVETSHALTIQWDSGIVSPAQWSDEFLGCDYVGAPWGWHGDAHEVGNGGFSLRSRRLMQYVAEHRETFPLGHPEDDVLCRRYRPELERAGFRWASERSGVALFIRADRLFRTRPALRLSRHLQLAARCFRLAALQERTSLAGARQLISQPAESI